MVDANNLRYLSICKLRFTQGFKINLKLRDSAGDAPPTSHTVGLHY